MVIGGRYSLEREIGRGGMGAVWLGRDELLGRPVAIKRLGAPAGTDSLDLERAEREARIAAHLNHPNVVAVFDLVREGDVVWLVMEYVAGATLAEVIRRNQTLPIADTAAVLGQVAEALTAAHAAGIVHRDVKPSNILVGDDGSVKISDFGIARASSDSHLTQTGLVTGSPAYLAPEVASGGPATIASDVWSLGATAFHAVTGHPPYDVGENLMGALYRIVHEAPPRAEGADWLAPLVESTMVHDPARRWNMSDIVEFLSRTSGAVPGHQVRADLASQEAPAPDAADDRVAASYAAALTRHRPAARRRKPVGVLPLLVLAAAIALVVMVGLLVTQDTSDSDRVNAAPTQTPSPSPSSSDEPTAEPQPSESPEPPEEPRASEAGIEAFISDYLTTASRNPSEGFTRLTPSFQRASPRYDEFWRSVRNPQISSISADADDLTVTYVYRYTRDGQGRRSEEVTLQLAFKDGTYLIDGES